MLFKDYRITYLDENQISLGQEEVTFRADAASAEQLYTVNMGYTPQDEQYHFEGWKVREGSSNIVGYTDGAVYKNTNVITITGDVTFGVNAPKGNWFIFDENGKGATYNAPQFVYSEDKPTRPNDASMIRNGYTFGGWFADKATADQTSGGTQYDFNQTLSDKTTVYARWIPKTTANYTIIIWKQNLAADGYDYVESISKTGNVGSTINTVRSQGTGNNAYAQVQRTGTTWSNVQYTGFHLKEFDQNVTIKTEGNSVLNIYYDRNEHTLTFQVPVRVNNPSNYDQNIYGYADNLGYVKLTRRSNRWEFQYDGDWYRYSSYGNGYYYHYSTVKTITALYQQSIGNNFPIVGDNGVTYNNGERWDPQSTTPYSEVLVYIDVMPAADVTFHLNTADHTTKHIHYYIEALSSETPTRTYNGMGFVEYKSVDANYNWFTEDEDYIDLVGFSKGGNTYPPEAYNAYGQRENTVWSNNSAIDVYCYYTRNVYPINFMDGVYVNGDGNPMEETGIGQIGTESDIAYGADVSSHNAYTPDEAQTPAGYVFEGWYIDSACTQKYTFDKMPEGGITVYAKWRQKQYRVFLHVNYPEGASGNINWGTTNQAMTFRISEGGHVSEPTGRDLAGYAFDGWYLDPEFTQVFNGEAYVINESNVTTPYDKTVDMTDTYDNNGFLIDPQYNSDATGYEGGDRFWITKKLDIYAKWHATLEGASGIVVEYDAAGGSGAPTDNHTYVDTALAPAGAASKAPAGSNKVFGYWEVQKWNGSEWVGTGTKVLPGKTFSVLKANAKVEDLPTPTASGDTKKYTVMLKAVYIDSEAPTPTHISWFKNDGTAAYETDENAKINVGVDIHDAPTRDGYTFLGWARVATSTSDDYETAGTEAAAWEASPNNWTQNLTASDLYLYYAEDGTYHLNSTDGTAVTQVAPDENLPYHAMFAVWEENEVTINYAVASDSTGMGTVAPASEKVKVATGTAAGSTATASSNTYVFDYWTVDDGTESISTDAAFVPSKNSTSGLYEEHTYYAHFKLNKADYTVEFYYQDENLEYKKAELMTVTRNDTIGETVSVTDEDKAKTTYEGQSYTLNTEVSKQSAELAASGTVLKLYFDRNVNAAIEVTKTAALPEGKTTFSVGDTITYTVTVENTGNVTVDTLAVTDPLPDIVLGQLDKTTIAPEETATLTATYVAKQSDVDAGEIENTATATGNDPSDTQVTDSDDETVTADAAEAAIEVTKTANKEKYSYNETVTFTITVTNTGNVTLSGLEIEDQLEGIQRGTLDKTTIAPGETATETATYVVTAGNASDGSLTNKVKATANDPSGESIDGEGSVTVDIDKVKLSITADSASKVYDGDALTDDGWNDTAPTGLVNGDTIESVKVEGSQTLVGESANTASAAKVVNKAGDDVTGGYEIEYVKGTLAVTDGTGEDEDPVDPALVVTKADADEDAGAYHVGDTVTFDVTATNIYEEAQDIELSEIDGVTLAETTFENVKGGETVSTTATYTITVADVAAGKFTNTVTAEVGNIEKTADATVTTEKAALKITADSASKVYDGAALTDDGWQDTPPEGLVNGDTVASVTVAGSQTLVGSSDNVASGAVVKNTAGADVTGGYEIEYVDGTLKVTDGTNPDDPSEVEDDLVVSKSHTIGAFGLGDTVTFDVTATNIYGEAQTITLEEIEGVTLKQSTFENVAGGETVSTTATYTITEADILAQTFKNTVKATVGNVTKTAEDTVDASEIEDPAPHLAVVKKTTSEQPEGGYALGDEISYEITVTNDGNLTVSDITLTDTVKGYDAADITANLDKTELKPGEVATAEFTHEVTEQDILAGLVANEATATGTNPSDEPTGDEPGTTEDPTEEPAPHLTVVKTTTSEKPEGGYALGNEITYEITVTNDGNLTVSEVALTDTVAGYDAEDITANLDKTTLKPGESATAEFSHEVTEQDILAGSVVNEATATGTNPSDEPTGDKPGTTEDEVEDLDTTMTVSKTIDISKLAEGYVFKLGDVIDYIISITNDGNVTYKNVVVTDKLSRDGARVTIVDAGGGTVNADNSVTFESLGVGSTVTILAQYIVTEADILIGSVTNAATAAGDEIDDPKNPDEPKTPEGSDEVTTGDEDDPDNPPAIEDPNGHLTINKVTTSTPANGEAYALGEQIAYQITAVNDGNLTITDITVTDELTSDEWPIASLAPGAEQSFTATYTVTENDILDGEVVNVATAKGTSPDPDEPEVPVEPGTDPEPTVDKNGHITITKTTTSQTPAGGYELGATISYQITATNDGNLTIRNITVNDELTGDEWTIASLAPGASQSFNATYTVTEADVLAGEVVNVATGKGTSPDPDEPEVPVVPGEDPEPTVTPNDNVTVNKTVVTSPANGATYGTGEVIRYMITVTNTGNVTLSNVRVSDQMTGATGTPVITAAAGAGYTVAGSVATIASLAPGATVTIPVSYTVLVSDAGASITNAAVASGTSPNDPSNPTTGTDTTDPVPVTPAPTPTPTPAAVTPAPAAPAAAVVPVVAPTPAAPAVTPIADNPTPQAETVTDDGNALGDGGAWSLFDLICTILTTILAAIMLIGALGRIRKEGDDEEEAAAKRANGEEVDYEEVYKRKRIGRILSIVPAIGAIILFILTQDLTQPMIIFDIWSLVFAIIAIINIVLAIVTRKKTDDDEDEEQQTGYAPAGA